MLSTSAAKFLTNKASIQNNLERKCTSRSVMDIFRSRFYDRQEWRHIPHILLSLSTDTLVSTGRPLKTRFVLGPRSFFVISCGSETLANVSASNITPVPFLCYPPANPNAGTSQCVRHRVINTVWLNRNDLVLCFGRRINFARQRANHQSTVISDQTPA